MNRVAYATEMLADVLIVHDHVDIAIGLCWVVDADDPAATHADAEPAMNPEQLVEATSHLDDDAFRAFVSALGLMIDLYLGYIRMDGWHSGIDLLVDDVMRQSHPEAYRAIVRAANT